MIFQEDILSRNLLFYSEENMLKIRKASVIIGGVGGLGCVVAEILTRIGLKRLILIDNGIIDKPDLGRQILYDLNDVGKKKVAVAKEKLLKKAGLSEIEIFDSDIKNSNLPNIIEDVDGLVDCFDNYQSRFNLEKHLKDGQFLVHGGVENNFGQITTIIKNKTPSLAELYANTSTSKKIIPVSTVAVFVIASLMSQEIINNILNEPQLSNRMLIVELSDFSLFKINLSKNQQTTTKSKT